MSHYDWLDRRVSRSVDNLKLWSLNPRLDPEEKHNSLHDFILDLISAEKEAFFKLIDSISSEGFIPGDPIVVWKDEGSGKHIVAEGNRRVMALKLLRNPEKAPRSIRAYIRKKSAKISRDSLEKIKVCIAPNFESCEWYVTQRHSNNMLHRSWSRLQQQRWIAELYDKYRGDIEIVSKITGLGKSQLDFTLRILNVRDIAAKPEILKQLNDEEKDQVLSHRIPMTILERWFMHPKVKERWGVEFDGTDLLITSDKDSFYVAYATWLKYVIHRKEHDVPVKIDTRTITSGIDAIFSELPEVTFTGESIEISDVDPVENEKDPAGFEGGQPGGGKSKKEERDGPEIINNNPDRNQLIPNHQKLRTSSNKLNALFSELQKMPVYKYKNAAASSLRVFLDLSVEEYLRAEGKIEEVATQYKKTFFEVTLKQKLEFIKKNCIRNQDQGKSLRVLNKLLNPSNEHSLDTLNNYIHGTDQQHTNKRFLNGFWDFLSPLLEVIVCLEN